MSASLLLFLKCGRNLNDNFTFDVDNDRLIFFESRVTRSDGVDDFLVERPDFVPFHLDDGAGRTLSDDELFQSLDSHAVTQHAADGRETRIVPAVDMTVLNEPCQFAFGQHRIDHIQSGVLPNVWLTQFQNVNKPMKSSQFKKIG